MSPTGWRRQFRSTESPEHDTEFDKCCRKFRRCRDTSATDSENAETISREIRAPAFLPHRCATQQNLNQRVVSERQSRPPPLLSRPVRSGWSSLSLPAVATKGPPVNCASRAHHRPPTSAAADLPG